MKATFIALFGTVLLMAVNYPNEVADKKAIMREQVRADFNWLTRDLNYQLGLLKAYFEKNDTLDVSCDSSTLQVLRKAHFKIPNIAEVGIVNPQGYLFCTSWQKLAEPINTSGPKPIQNQKLRFFGPIHTSVVGEPALVIARTRSDGYEMNALLPQSILQRHINDLGRPYSYVAIVDGTNGVPIAKEGNYTLPVGYTLFPIKEPTFLEGYQFDDGNNHFLLTKPLEHLPSLALMIAIDEKALFKRAYFPSFTSLFIYSVTFLLLFFLTKAYQQRYKSKKSELREAIQKGQVTNFYQLIWNAEKQSFLGAETLVRLNDPQEGILGPHRFLADIERCNLMASLTYAIVDNLLQESEALTKQLGIHKVNINITGELLKDEKLKAMIFELNKCIPTLVLELTENELVELDNQDVIKTINDFRAQNILIAIDDFGTGYAGLQYLKSLPLDIIKIDQSYVAAINTGSQLATMLDALIDLAKTFKIDVVAEGVETTEQADYLMSKGVYLHQGWKYHKACSIEEIELTVSS